MSTTTLYDTIHDVPQAERPAAKEADRLAAKATLAAYLSPAELHAAYQAMVDHQRKTGWRYLPSGQYQHRTQAGATP